jgi:PKD domain-containing protein
MFTSLIQRLASLLAMTVEGRAQRPGQVAGQARMRIGIALLLLALLSTTGALLARGAGAETFGQVGDPLGGPGTGNGQFFNPGAFGVDPTDGSIYAGDETENGQSYRIQKLTEGGAFKGSVLIPRFVEPEKLATVHGIAVDHSEGRFYVVEGCRVTTTSSACRKLGPLFSARQILVFKTEPEGTNLVSAGSPLTLPTGTEQLYEPQAIAVDPSNHDLVILAENADGHAVIQRFSKTGAAGARFTDTGDILRPSAGRQASGLVVTPTGKTLTMTGGEAKAEYTRAWELPANLASISEVADFEKAGEEEGWANGLVHQVSPLLGGPQLALSPDGKTLYWKEGLEASTESEAGSVVVRGYSLTEKKTSMVYGGAVEVGRCEILTDSSALGAVGNKMITFDFGPPVETGETPSYGDRILVFGPGGTGCPTGGAKLIVNGSEDPLVSVKKGDEVKFVAEETSGKPITEVEWDFGDGTTETLKTPTTEHPERASHHFTELGEHVVKVTLNPTGAALVAERPVSVLAVTPTAFFLPSTYNPAAGSMVKFDAGESFDPGGGSCSVQTGCPGSFSLKKYHWSFGDGSAPVDSSTPIVEHAFSNPAATPVEREVTLTVTSFDDAQSNPQIEFISVQGTPSGGGGGGESGGGGGGSSGGGGSTPPPPPPPPTPEPQPSKPTLAEKRAEARKKCKKHKKGKALKKCLKKANAIGRVASRPARGRG